MTPTTLLLLVLLVIPLLAQPKNVRRADQRNDDNWPYEKEYSYPSDVSLNYSEPHLVHVLSRSSFYVELEISHSGTGPFNVYVLTDVEWTRYSKYGIRINNATNETTCAGENDRICCWTQKDDNGVFFKDCNLKIRKDFVATVDASDNPSTVSFSFNRLSYKDEFLDYGIVISELREFIRHSAAAGWSGIDNNDYVLNLRSADHITRVVLFENVEETSSVSISSVFVKENYAAPARSPFRRVVSRLFSAELIAVDLVILVSVAVIVFSTYNLCQIILCCKKGRQILGMGRMVKDGECSRLATNCGYGFVIYAKESNSATNIIWEILTLCCKCDMIKIIEDYAVEHTDYADEVESDRQDRKLLKTPGLIASWVFFLFVVYYVEFVIESLGTRLATPTNPCAISDLCCGLMVLEVEEETTNSTANWNDTLANWTDIDDTADIFDELFGAVDDVLDEDIDEEALAEVLANLTAGAITIIPQADGDIEVNFEPHSYCVISSVPANAGELTFANIETVYEKCLYSSHTYPLCRVNSTSYGNATRDTRELCADVETAGMVVGNTDRNCDSTSFFQNSLFNSYFMKVVYFTLSLIITQPFLGPTEEAFTFVSMWITFFVLGCSGVDVGEFCGEWWKRRFNYDPEDPQMLPVAVALAKFVLKIVWGVISCIVIIVFFLVVVVGVFRATDAETPEEVAVSIAIATFMGILTSVFQSMATFIILFKWTRAVKDDGGSPCGCCVGRDSVHPKPDQ